MRRLIPVIPIVLAVAVVGAQYVPNDLVRSVDYPTIHVTFDNQAAGAGSQAETFTNAGTSRLYRRLAVRRAQCDRQHADAARLDRIRRPVRQQRRRPGRSRKAATRSAACRRPGTATTR
jgi:hypothetical protein